MVTLIALASLALLLAAADAWWKRRPKKLDAEPLQDGTGSPGDGGGTHHGHPDGHHGGFGGHEGGGGHGGH